MTYPLLYELNTRCWLRSLSEREGRVVTLANVPENEIARWQQMGFTHVWVMGVWTTGPLARAHVLDDAALRAAFDQLVPGWKAEDVAGSPYAIADYTVPSGLGGEDGLAEFRRKLHARGIKLLLDFVPNHVGLDHPWLTTRPELFVQTQAQQPGAFEQRTVSGNRWMAHGKDPYFAPWTDTAQLDYRNPETRVAMIELLQGIARRCDGVRCDMAMLQLNDVFAKTWSHISVATTPPASEFWSDAINAVKKNRGDFLFLAEAYWGLEPRLQSLGFDYTYCKMLHDRLRDLDHVGLQRDLLAMPDEVLARSAHFLENHDEPRAASMLSPAEHRAAALLLLGLPGMRLIYDGQLEGRKLQTPVQLGHWPDEPVDPEISAMYKQLFSVLKHSVVGHGNWHLLQPIGWPDNQSAQNMVVVQWQKATLQFELVVVNLSPHPAQCVVKLSISNLAEFDWELRDILGHQYFERRGAEFAKGLFLDLPGHAAQLFRFERRVWK